MRSFGIRWKRTAVASLRLKTGSPPSNGAPLTMVLSSCLVTDMMMPGMNGHELAERIVRLRPDIPVMFVSGHPEAEVGDNTLIGRKGVAAPQTLQ